MSFPAHVIALGNEKGGSGKSTTAMHIFVALARQGRRVGAVDLDTRQKSFFRYLENRKAFAERRGIDLLMPAMREVGSSDHRDLDVAEQEELERFSTAMTELMNTCDVVIVDCPGKDTYLSRLGHGAADTLITPLNDSFVDFDLLAHVDVSTGEIMNPSVYAEMVWEARKVRAEQQLPELNWVVLRNRLPVEPSQQSKFVGDMLERLAKRQRFRVVPGFKERTIYREMFLQGLTVFDLREAGADSDLKMSQVAARQEVRGLLDRLELPDLAAAAAV